MQSTENRTKNKQYSQESREQKKNVAKMYANGNTLEIVTNDNIE